jgi:AcrR family transcriptional regulator
MAIVVVWQAAIKSPVWLITRRRCKDEYIIISKASSFIKLLSLFLSLLIHNFIMAKERKQQIIRAAVKRFARHGLGKTTLDEIARDIRIGKATIYHYFESKDELFFASLKWEADQFIEDIKAIFNNEELAVGARLLEYISYKENIDTRYKLLFNLILQLVEDESFEKEKEIIKSLLNREEEIVKLVLSSIYSSRLEGMNESLPNFIVTSSWGAFFGNRINHISHPDRVLSSKEFVFKSLENILS